MAAERFVVVGCFLVDCLVETDRLPAWGDDLRAGSVRLAPGGKGLNQAVTLARLGARVDAVGVIGDDTAGRMVLDTLAAEGVGAGGVEVRAGARTPTCVCLRRSDGETAFLWRVDTGVVDTGALDRAGPLLSGAGTVILTYDQPADVLSAAITRARRAGARVVLHPGPMNDAVDPRRLPWDGVDVLVPNEVEARALLTDLGYDGGSAAPADGLAEALARATGTRTVVVTLGALGCVVAGAAPGWRPALPVDRVVDTTAASDAFTAALAYHLGTGAAVDTAVDEAQGIAATVVTHRGGYDAIRRALA